MSRLTSTALSTALGLALATGFAVNPAHADEIYGTGAQWMVYSAAEFHASEPNCSIEYYSNYNYMRPAACSGGWAGYYELPIHLPEGAKIYSMRLIAFDNDATNDISLSLNRATQSPYYAGSGSSNTYTINNTVSTTGQQTYEQGITGSFTPMTFDTYDYPASTDAVFFSLRVIIPASSSSLTFHSVQLYWQRQSAPAPATATYSDVPTSDPFFNDVEQLSKSGITQGCGGGKFCPNSAVTRAQMAAFLHRALGLHWDWSTN